METTAPAAGTRSRLFRPTLGWGRMDNTVLEIAMNSVNATLKLVQEIAKLVRARLPLGPALGRLANLGSVPVGRAASDLVASLDGGVSLRDA